MTRFQRLAAATVVTTFLLVTLGVVVRSTESGVACPTWPGCFPGQFLPGLGSDYHVWLEWIHRTIAAIIGFLILGMAAFAILDHRDRPSILWPSIVAVGLVGFQAWLGRETVLLGNSGESVTAHLAAAMALEGLLVYLLVRAGFPARIGGRGGSQRFTLLASFGAVSTYALLLFGSHVTAESAWNVYPDWPLMNGTLLPPLVGAVPAAQVLHRWVAIAVGIVVATIVIVALRSQRRHRFLVALAVAAGVLFPIQALIGGLQILTGLAPWTQILHVALGALIWGAMVALAVAAYCTARFEPARAGSGSDVRGGSGNRRRDETMPVIATAVPADVPATAAAVAGAGGTSRNVASADGTSRSRAATVRAYVALTKPRIIELLLVTTVPAMVLAARQVPGMPASDFAGLVMWTLVGGSLAAGSANAINCYLDRDIDSLMARTRRRPLPAHEVEPERAVVFGIALAIVSVALMAYTVNLVAAFLTLLAIAFYVVVYTVMLKRTTTQNIVIGGAAGALPPVIGWAAVTGSIGLPAILLFLLVFYWTPPHFWALSLRIRKDYAAAGVPMLPVVKGIAETTRQIALYTILLVAISLAFGAVARMGLIYLGSAVVLGAIFLWQAYRLWRVGTSGEAASTAGAIRLYKYSISYLTLLFVAIAIDAIVALPLG